MAAGSDEEVTSQARQPGGRRKTLTIIVIAVVVVALLAAGAVLLLSQADVPLDRVEILDAPTSIDQRQEVVVRARALDASGADRTIETTFRWSTAVPGPTRVTAQGAQATVMGYSAGSGTIVVNATLNNRGKEANVTVAVVSLAFEVTPSSTNPVVGDSVTLTVRALRGAAAATGYRGTVNFTADVPSRLALPADAAFSAADNGVKVFTGLQFLSHGPAIVTAKDTLVPITGETSLRGRAAPRSNFFVEGIERTGADLTVRVNATTSNDPDGTIDLYNWTWGDGQSSELASPRTDHLYAGSYEDQAVTIVLRVRDNEGLAGSSSRLVTITFTPLRPTASFQKSGPDPLSWYVSVDATASTDPNGDLVYYNWTWGDGKTTVGTDPMVQHRYPAEGTYTINLTVEDLTNLKDWAEQSVTVNPRPFSIDYTLYDFFNVPYEEFWDKRGSLYWELPLNAEFFSQACVDNENCTPSNPDVDDVLSYPYMHYYSPGTPGDPKLIPSIWAPYRMNVTGVNVPGYSLAQPVILPVFNYSQAAGSRLDFDWYMQYLDSKREYELSYVCGTNFVFGNDGYVIESQVVLTMDLQESKRIFDVRGTTPAEAAAWWSTNTNPDCIASTAFEVKVNQWFQNTGGTQFVAGKYDIENGYEWYYQSFAINVSATVDPGTGLTTVRIDHAAWGTEALMGRWLYWGNVSYLDNHLDDTQRAGWWGMEQSWFEDFRYRGQLGSSTLDFDLKTVVQYHLQELCRPGPNGLYDRTDDFAFWQWGPYLLDYVNDFSRDHTASELDRYPGLSFVHCAPGQPSSVYGADLEYDYTPNTWNLRPGETWHFQFPRGSIVVHDPNTTPPAAKPQLGQFVEVPGPLELWNAKPAGYGEWDPILHTWDVYGPAISGGPDGSPGPDGVPGTPDDRYALEPWPQINFAVAGALPAAPLAASQLASSSVVMDRLEWIAVLPTPSGVRGATQPADGAAGGGTRSEESQRTKPVDGV